MEVVGIDRVEEEMERVVGERCEDILMVWGVDEEVGGGVEEWGEVMEEMEGIEMGEVEMEEEEMGVVGV